jgi:hypothetical protein
VSKALNVEDLLQAQQAMEDIELNKPNQISEEVFYLNERKARPIYQDEELHVLMLSLMMCLLLKP